MGKLARENTNFEVLALDYNVVQWRQMNKDKVALANRSRMGAEDIIDVSKVFKPLLKALKRARMAIEETAKHTRNGQREVNTRLEQRINKVEHWTGEIDEQLTLLNNEIDALLEYKVK